MKKLVPYVVVFVLGFAACAFIFNHYFGSPLAFSGVQSVNAPRGGLLLASKGANQVSTAANIVSQYVVNIDTVGRSMAESSPFDDFFGMPFRQPQEVHGQASGVIFTSDGYILTNNHVVEGAAKLSVTLHDGMQYNAKLVGRDPQTDLAVIKIQPKEKLSYATFGNSDTLRVGDWTIAVGNALGLGPTVTVGVVSAKRDEFDINGKHFSAIIQTDAAINQGNSGGALADINGNLVGINTAIMSTSPNGGSIGIGFAVPSKIAQRIADQLVKKGKVSRPYLGVRYTGLTEEIRQALRQRGVTNLPKEDGAIVVEVFNGTPAAEAGLQPQDVILRINGKPVSSRIKAEKGKTTITDAIGKMKIGDIATMEVWHAATGRTGSVGVRVAEMPANYGSQPEQ